ncbi:hypothetical protein San01_11140 [Streptomyces angustmyceticus]|uniref:Uncharacterized protein n=1 Tax=Streptomyces angustmyceticus TaxID=285578 RepID=A0A5J4L2N1_9ACTN|nr:hypothetical protein [Streptomyces angustmyceticus]GES28627.1 hypothetical protein San01_11140 [Streptomyces angustmyceticus]
MPNTIAPDLEGALGPEQDSRKAGAIRIAYQLDALFDTGMLGDTVSDLRTPTDTIELSLTSAL